MLRQALAACILLTATSDMALAQPKKPDLTRFKVFADPLVGEWNVRNRDFDAAGRLT